MKEIEILKGLQPNTPYLLKDDEGKDRVVKLGQKTDLIQFELGSFASTTDELNRRSAAIDVGCDSCTSWRFKDNKFCLQYNSNAFRHDHLKKYENAKVVLQQQGIDINPVVLDDISVSFLIAADDGSHYILNEEGVREPNKDFKYTYNFQIKIDCNV